MILTWMGSLGMNAELMLAEQLARKVAELTAENIRLRKELDEANAEIAQLYRDWPTRDDA